MKAQRGAAILLAMLMVALVATLSATALWQQWRGVEVEAAERERLQSSWILQGALDWARLILREDARAGSTDHLAEPWAVPLREARLSTFLAVGQGATDTTEPMQNVFMSGDISDLQARLNLANLVQGGQLNPVGAQAFTRLFSQLGLPEAELLALIEQLQRAQLAALSAYGTGEPKAAAKNFPNAPLQPTQFNQLAWLGLSPLTRRVLEPHITVLPQATPVNINTASPAILQASIAGLSLSDAQKLVAARALTHFSALGDAAKVLNNPQIVLSDATLSVASGFFEVRAALRVEDRLVFERAVVQRDGLQVKTLLRERFAGPGGSVQ
jgi:general secretion pathway protein K